jgi:hypothetical protein
MGLRICGGCCRHVRQQERRCPFCGARLAYRAESAPYGLAAAVALGIGVAVCACGDTVAFSPPYGPPPCPPLCGTDGASGSGGAGGATVLYPPPVDASTDANDGGAGD